MTKVSQQINKSDSPPIGGLFNIIDTFNIFANCFLYEENKMRKYEIRTNDDQIKYAGEAKSLSDLITNLILDGQEDFKNIHIVGPRSKLDITGLDLSNCDFSDATIVNADFSGSTITNANFNRASFSHSVFANCNAYTPATFIDAEIDSVDFSRSHLRNCNFTNATMRRCHFYDARLIGVKFSHTIQSKSRFIISNLSGTNWEDAYVEDSEFIGVNFGDQNKRIYSTGALFYNSSLREGEYASPDSNSPILVKTQLNNQLPNSQMI